MNMDLINDIAKQAADRGACALARQAKTVADLATIFFTPQGKEFCADNNFPSLQDFQRLKAKGVAQYGVYVDCGDVAFDNKTKLAVVGDTRATLRYEGVACKCTVIAMHGAQLKIIARNHAVIEVVNIGCKIDYDIDKTVVLL